MRDAGHLTTLEKKQLDEQGFLDLGVLLNKQQLQQVRNRTSLLASQEGDSAGSELLTSKHIRHPREAGVIRIANLVNKGSEFDLFYTQRKLLSAVSHILGNEFKLSSLNYREALPGSGAQNLHVDWRNAVSNEKFQVCNAIWLLDEFTPLNGATRIVPGSHQWGTLPEAEMDDVGGVHPDQRLFLGRAGSVFIFNSHTWHGGTLNRSLLPRRGIHSYFCLRDHPQQTNQRQMITRETRDRLDEKSLWLLDV